MNASQEPELPMSDRPKQFNLPSEIAILPLFGMVVYPMTVTPLAISQRASVQLIDEALRESDVIGLVALRNERARPEQITPEDCYRIGTAAVIHRLLRLPDGTLRIAAEGVERIALEDIVATTPALRARVRALPQEPQDTEADQQLQPLLAQVGALAQLLPAMTEELQIELLSEESSLRLAYLLAAHLLPHSSVAERQALLELDNRVVQFERLRTLLAREQAAAERAQQVSDSALTSSNQRNPLAQRQELLALPLAQELLALGRQQGQHQALQTVLCARFSVAPDLDTLLQRLATIHDSALLHRLLVLAATAEQLDDVAAVLGVEDN